MTAANLTGTNMTKKEKIQFINELLLMLEQQLDDMCRRLEYAKAGVSDGNIMLIMGGLSGIDGLAKQIKNIYETIKYINARQ